VKPPSPIDPPAPRKRRRVFVDLAVTVVVDTVGQFRRARVDGRVVVSAVGSDRVAVSAQVVVGYV